ncbi:MAG TPA: S53 family peptidase [Jatrophihabitans sp.]
MTSTKARRLTAVLAVLISTGATGAFALTGEAQAAQPRHPLPGTAPTWLSSAKKTADTKDSTDVSFGVLLTLRNQADAEATLADVSDPSSPAYGDWLTNSEFNAAYAPAASDISAVKAWLTGQGFSVSSAFQSGMYLSAHGPASQVEKTFDTGLASFTLDGTSVRANTTALSLPADAPSAVVSAIGGVLGLDQAVALKTPNRVAAQAPAKAPSTPSTPSTPATQPADVLPGPPAGFRSVTEACSDYFGESLATSLPKAYGKYAPWAVCGYTPSQIQSAYGLGDVIKSGINGKGITVAITDAFAAPTIVGDTAKYSANHGLPQFKSGQFSQIVPAANSYDPDWIDLCDAQGWYGEETLDVQAVHATAPGANIVYVGGSDCGSGLDEAWAETIDNHAADIITNSWTDYYDDPDILGPDYVDFYYQFSLEAALTGISVLFSSGDDGDHTNIASDDPADSAKSVEFPNDLPFVTSVGGTSLEVGKNGSYAGEYGWQSSYTDPYDGSAWSLPGTWRIGGGGGTSVLFAQPWYQRGVVPSSVATWTPDGSHGPAMRAVPDVAMTADANTGLIVGETQEFPDGTYYDEYRIGGTSLASPLFAGVLAVTSQQARHPVGFVNPVLYNQVGRNSVHDIKAPTSPVAQVRPNYLNGVDTSDGVMAMVESIDTQSTTLHDTKGWDDETGIGSPNGAAFVSAVSGIPVGHRSTKHWGSSYGWLGSWIPSGHHNNKPGGPGFGSWGYGDWGFGHH